MRGERGVSKTAVDDEVETVFVVTRGINEQEDEEEGVRKAFTDVVVADAARRAMAADVNLVIIDCLMCVKVRFLKWIACAKISTAAVFNNIIAFLKKSDDDGSTFKFKSENLSRGPHSDFFKIKTKSRSNVFLKVLLEHHCLHELIYILIRYKQDFYFVNSFHHDISDQTC